MTRPAGITIDGADRLESTLGAAARDLGDMDAANAAGDTISVDARPRAPVVSGRLAGSIAVSNMGNNHADLTAGDTTVVPYAAAIHNGWRAHNIAPNPFVFDAIEATRTRWEGDTVDELDAIIGKVKGA